MYSESSFVTPTVYLYRKGKPPYRIWIIVMIFWCSTLNYVFLGHFQISLLAMIDKNIYNSTKVLSHNIRQENYGPRYAWSIAQEGQLISAYYYGVTCMSFPGGIFCQYFGPFKTILGTVVWSALINCISVFVVGNNWIPLFVCRILLGLAGAMAIPALNGLIATWAPPEEKSTFAAAILGFVFGSLITPPSASLVIQYMGWKWSFYGTAIASVIFCLAWFLLVADYPSDSWFCSKDEAQFIEESQEGAIQRGWARPPLLRMMTSIPFLITILGHFAVMGVLCIIYALLPKFLNEALKFDLQKVGIVAALPSIARLMMGIVYAAIVQVLFKKWNVRKKYVRKGFVLFSHILPGLVLCTYLLNFVIEFSECLIIGLLILTAGCGSAGIVTTSVNIQDLAPNFVGTMYGIMGVFGSTTGFIIPTITAKITEEKSEIPQWAIIFAIVGSLNLFCGIAFILFGSTELQAWNEKKSKQQVEESAPAYGPRYNWTYEWEQHSISSLFYGLTVISIPAGFFVTLFGPWHVLVWSSVIMAVCTDLAVPMAYYVGPGGVFTMRFLVGIMVGLQYPAMQNLISNWAPPHEKGKFVACMMGNAFGSIVTMPVTGLIIEQFGWSWSFYALTPIVLVFCIAMVLLVADHPRNYRWIREEEKTFIEESHGASVNTAKKKKNPPYLKMFMSCPFYALIVGQFGNQYNLFLALTIVPQYLKRVLKFNLKESAGIAALPQVSRLVFGFLFGALNDFLIHRGVQKKYCRKGFTIFSHILTGITLCLFLAIGGSSIAAICLLVLMMAFNGAAVVTVLINSQDLAPNWSGTLYGIMNFFGGWGGFLGPILVNNLTRENTIGQWAIVFCIGGAIGIVTGILFILFGSVEIQPWNNIEEAPPPPLEEAPK